MARDQEECVSIDRSRVGDGVAVVYLSRERSLNALNRALLEQLVAALKSLAQEKVPVVILTGKGRAFSAGVDLRDAQSIFQDNDAGDVASHINLLESYPGVTIGAINGFAFTGGFELALGCDILLGSENTVFADTHTKFGIHPSWGLSQKLSKIIGPSRARMVSLTGRRVDAATALSWGLVAEVHPAEELLGAALQMAAEINRNHPRMVKKVKKLCHDGWHLPLGQGREMEIRSAKQYASSMTMEDFMEIQRFIASRSKGRPRSKL